DVDDAEAVFRAFPRRIEYGHVGQHLFGGLHRHGRRRVECGIRFPACHLCIGWMDDVGPMGPVTSSKTRSGDGSPNGDAKIFVRLQDESSLLSQARAMRQSFDTVPCEMPRASAVSSMVSPPKYRASTTRTQRGCTSSMRVRASSISMSLSRESFDESPAPVSVTRSPLRLLADLARA